VCSGCGKNSLIWWIGIFFQQDMTISNRMPLIPSSAFSSSTEVVFLLGGLALLLPLAMSLVLFQQPRSVIRDVISSNELEIFVGRSTAGGEALVVRLIMQGEPQSLQAVRMNRRTRSWYDPLHFIKQEIKRRIRGELNAQSETLPIFPGSTTHLVVSVLFVATTNKDLDNMLKPLLDILEGIIYENDDVIYEIYTRKIILSGQAVAVPDGAAKVDVIITPTT
jgi:Holliday junction resolvase RusA-like endonuclease